MSDARFWTLHKFYKSRGLYKPAWKNPFPGALRAFFGLSNRLSCGFFAVEHLFESKK